LAIGQGNDFEQTCRYMNAAHRMAFHAYTNLKDYEAHETPSTFEIASIAFASIFSISAIV
jgi:hypothetical protein